jgi:hypothetical protein
MSSIGNHLGGTSLVDRIAEESMRFASKAHSHISHEPGATVSGAAHLVGGPAEIPMLRQRSSPQGRDHQHPGRALPNQ